MSKENLIILSPEEARKQGKKGGLVKSEAKKYANLVNASKRALCKNCQANCVFKESNLAQAKNAKCIVPKARADAIHYGRPVMSEEVLEKLDTITLFKLIKESKGVKDLKMVHDAISNKKKLDHPKVQQLQVDQRVAHFSFDDMRRVYDEVHREAKE